MREPLRGESLQWTKLGGAPPEGGTFFRMEVYEMVEFHKLKYRKRLENWRLGIKWAFQNFPKRRTIHPIILRFLK